MGVTREMGVVPLDFEECTQTWGKEMFKTYFILWNKQNGVIKTERVLKSVVKMTIFDNYYLKTSEVYRLPSGT